VRNGWGRGFEVSRQAKVGMATAAMDEEELQWERLCPWMRGVWLV
jgi:hypothetical protein